MIDLLMRFMKHLALMVGLEGAYRRFVGASRAYQMPAGPSKCLDPDALKPVPRRRGTEADIPSNALYDVWRSIPGAHKWLHYFEIYEHVFAPLTTRPIRMLEIGVYKGGSLEMWRRYLHPQSTIVGVDIDPACAKFDDPKRGVFVRIGDQSNAEFLRSLMSEFGLFDVVLDDGSHICSHMVASFRQLFLAGLHDNGVYIAEDTHTNFWESFRDQPYSFVDLAKDLVDWMHSHYVGNDFERKFRLGGPDQLASISVPTVSAHIKEISFHDSIVVIRKRPHQRLPASQHL